MPTQLGQGLAQFTPELQQQLFERGVNGIDLTNGIPVRGPSPEQVERLQTLENVYNMVQNGELVPKQIYQNPVKETHNQQTYVVPQQPVVQNAPAQVQNDVVATDNASLPQDDFMKMLFPDQQNPVPPVNPVTNQVPDMRDGSVQNEKPSINWEEVVFEQQNVIRSESAKQGIKGDEVLQWINTLGPEDYVEMFKAVRQYNAQPQQPPMSPAPQNNFQQRSSSLIDWSAQQNSQQYVPSIADMPGANVTTVQRGNARPAHPFGLNVDGYR